MTPRLFTFVGAAGALGGLIACVVAIVLALRGNAHGAPTLGFAVVVLVFSTILFVVGLDLWSDCDRLAEYDL